MPRFTTLGRRPKCVTYRTAINVAPDQIRSPPGRKAFDATAIRVGVVSCFSGCYSSPRCCCEVKFGRPTAACATPTLHAAVRLAIGQTPAAFSATPAFWPPPCCKSRRRRGPPPPALPTQPSRKRFSARGRRACVAEPTAVMRLALVLPTAHAEGPPLTPPPPNACLVDIRVGSTHMLKGPFILGPMALLILLPVKRNSECRSCLSRECVCVCRRVHAIIDTTRHHPVRA